MLLERFNNFYDFSCKYVEDDMKRLYSLLELLFNHIRGYIYKKITGNKSKALKVTGKVYFWNKRVSLGNNVTIYPGVTFSGTGIITIGDNVVIGNNTIIMAKDNICIGDNTLIAAQCYITDNNHNIKKGELIKNQGLSTKQKLRIGEDCWIGANSTLIPGAFLGKGCVIGANSLVNSIINDYEIAVGCPAKKIKERK